jgi:hypothetical protein
LATDIYTLLINRGSIVTGATAALGIAAASFGGDGEDGGGDGGAKDTAESPTALPERTKKNHKACEASAKHLSAKRHESDTNGFSTKGRESDTKHSSTKRTRIRHEKVFSPTANSHHDLHQFLYQIDFS